MYDDVTIKEEGENAVKTRQDRRIGKVEGSREKVRIELK